MNASTPGVCRTGRVDRRTVLLAKVATFTEHKRIEGVPGGLVEGKEVVAVEPNKNNNEG